MWVLSILLSYAIILGWKTTLKYVTAMHKPLVKM